MPRKRDCGAPAEPSTEPSTASDTNLVVVLPNIIVAVVVDGESVTAKEEASSGGTTTLGHATAPHPPYFSKNLELHFLP